MNRFSVEISDVAGTGTALLAGDLDLSPSELKLTEDDLEELFKDCSKGKCKFCVKKAGFEGEGIFFLHARQISV